MIRLIPVAILLTLMGPPAIFAMLSASSMAVGILLCAVMWSFLGFARSRPPHSFAPEDLRFATGMLVVIALLSVQLAASSFLVHGTDAARFYSSCVTLFLVCIGASFAAKTLLRAPETDLVRAADLGLTILWLLGLAAALGAPGLGAQPFAKPVVFFSEPSHFALAYLPLMTFRAAVARRPTQLFIVGVSLLLALILQSLTMVLGILLVSALLLRRGTLLLMVCALAVILATVDLSYYTDRLSFSSDTKNLSTLVFLQGWEDAILNFSETNGLGVGFQQFGVAGSIGDIAQKIASLLTGSYLNLRDGGSTAAKIVGEFGVLGIIMLIGYLVAAARGIRFVRAAQSIPVADRQTRNLFFHCLVICYLFELFVRGLGYFSPGSFLALASLVAIRRSRTARLPLKQMTAHGALPDAIAQSRP